MSSTDVVFGMDPSDVLSRRPASRRDRGRWLAMREVLGGAVLVVAWIALWTAIWAAIAGPLAPVDELRRTRVAAVERGP